MIQMYKLFCFIGLVLFFLSCRSTSGIDLKTIEKSSGIMGITLRSFFPVVDNNGKFILYDPQYAEIYYYGNQVLYRTHYTFSWHTKDGGILKEEKRTRNLVHTKGNPEGYYSDSSLAIFNKKVLVDSMLNKEWYELGLLSSVLKNTDMSLVSSFKNENVGILNETYLVQSKIDTTQKGMIFLSFSNAFKDIAFTLSKELDETKKMKLSKIKIVNDARFLKGYNINIERIEQTREMELIPIKNAREIIKYFKGAQMLDSKK
jgi:hypothetical protein